MDHLLEGDAVFGIESGLRVVRREKLAYLGVQDFVAVWSESAVVLDTLQPPPWSIATVVAWIDTTAEEVGDETMTYAGSKGENS